MDGAMYRKILDEDLLPSARTPKMGLPAWQWPKTYRQGNKRVAQEEAH